MSAPSKSNTPTPATTTQSKDWTKAATLELNAGTDNETEHKQARLVEQERQHWEQEEAECKAREEVEHKAKEEAERKAVDERQVWEEAARAQMAAERAQAESEAEQAWVEVEKKRMAEEEAAKKRAAEVAAKQQESLTDVSKKRAREEPEAGPSGSGEAEAGGTRARCMHCVKAKAKCKRSGRKHQHACDRCAGLKEKCEWPEAGGTGVGKGKGKEPEKLVIASPHSGEKHKRTKKAAAKDNNNNNEIEQVAGPLKGKGKERARSRSRSGSGDNNRIVQGLDRLVVAVEKLTEGVRIMTAAHKSVYHAGVITEQILHEYKLFLAPEFEGEEWESKEEVNQVEVEAEVEELECEMVEAGDPGLPKKKELVQKGPVVDNSREGFDGE
ncbi:hypothetical protein SCLCIDRAFT_32235 [Scleroderma citrinum Foug A]|uniref:Zn(2)-C6 fungal-type domain-containing protein n=1 Tax=Scleroderma citrinum Foug A TaxID=1036808 RepID=A0A0C3DA20_9AGAM|nr:hypothetical protein SCLCIDRAFT_32235 [Scleroderma citrinum Foug A]